MEKINKTRFSNKHSSCIIIIVNIADQTFVWHNLYMAAFWLDFIFILFVYLFIYLFIYLCL